MLVRLIMSPPAPGAAQMALDEALLEHCALDPAGFMPVLRLYQFAPACLSLGRLQPLSDIDVAACARNAIDVVRRPSGGRAVLHERDLTYAIIAPTDGPIFSGGVRASAARIGTALLAAVNQLGVTGAAAASPYRATSGARDHRPRRHPPDCFAVAGAYEITVAGRKIAGSAQVRRDGAALQHGTIRLRPDAGDATPYLNHKLDSDACTRTAAGDSLAMRPMSLAEALGRDVAFSEVAAAAASAFAATLDLSFRPAEPTAPEHSAATRLEQERYRSPAWTMRR